MPVSRLFTATMPISQGVAWYLLMNDYPLYPSVCGISAFYCSWALYKRYIEGEKRELGHISMGSLAFVSFLNSKYLTVGGTVLVIVNFAAAAWLIVPAKNADLIKALNKTDPNPKMEVIWVYTFKSYLLASMAFWGKVLVEVIKT